MVDAVRMGGLTARKLNGWLFLGLLIANVLVLLSTGTGLGMVGGVLLFCVLPGLSLVNLAFSKSRAMGLLARVMLGAALSFVLSNLVVFGLSLLPGEMWAWQVVFALDVLCVILMAATHRHARADDCGIPKETGWTWAHAVLLFVVLCVFRFVGLGYSEYVAVDEIRLISFVNDVITGDGSLLDVGVRGPTQRTTVLAFVLFSGGYDEFALRLPFTLASIVSVIGLYLLGSKMFSTRAGFLSALLLALQGGYLALSRWAQYQPILALMAVCAVYCFWVARSIESGKDRDGCLALGTMFFAFGCLTHHGGILVAPALCVLYFSQRRVPLKRDLLLVGVCVVIFGAIISPYYIPFLFSQGARSPYLFNNRLGWSEGTYNHIKVLLFYMFFRNSVYYVLVVWIALIGALTSLRLNRQEAQWHIWVAGSSFVIGLLVSIWGADLVQVGSVSYAFVFFLPLLAILLFGTSLDVRYRAVWLWFLSGFGMLAFFVRLPLSQWYVMAAPWALLSGTAIDRGMSLVDRKASLRRYRLVAWGLVGALALLFSGYLYVFFLQRVPEYASGLPEHRSPAYPVPELSGSGSGVLLYGTPGQTGQKVIGALYRLGVLRGHSRISSDVYSDRIASEWYLGHKWDVDEDSRYVVFSGDRGVGYSTEEIEQWYDLVGRVLVNGVAKLWIFEKEELADGGPYVDYRFEEYEPVYDEMASLYEQRRLREVKADKKTYYREAGLVDATSEPGDEIVFTEREQVGLFSYHYTGDLPYHIPERVIEPRDLDTWLRELEGTGNAYIVYWAASENREQAMWDEWLNSHDAIREKAWHGNVGLAVYSESGEVDLHLLEVSRLGDSIELLGYEARYEEESEEVKLVLYWTMEEYVWKDYTVFAHLVDSEDNLIGQRDNPPGRGLSPTSAWRTDKVVRDEYEIPVGEEGPAEYWIEVGMYDTISGDRLPASGEGAQADGRIRLPLPVAVGVSMTEGEE